MKQVLLSAPGLRDPGGIGQKWTNDGYQERDEKSGGLRTVTEKWEKGKNVIRTDVHKDDPNPYKKVQELQEQSVKGFAEIAKNREKQKK